MLRACLTILLLLCSDCIADVLYLKNGQKIDCKVVSQGKDKIVVKIAYGTMSFTTNEVERIVSESEQTYLTKQGASLAAHGAFAESARQYTAALKSKPTDEKVLERLRKVYLDWADVCLKQGNYGRVLGIVDAALSLFPGARDFEGYKRVVAQRRSKTQSELDIIDLLFDKGDVAGGISRLKSLETREPERQDTIRRRMCSGVLLLAQAKLLKKEFIEAILLYREAQAVYPPEYARFEYLVQYCLRQQCSVYLSKENYSSAKEYAEQLCGIDQKDVFGMFVMGFVSDIDGDRDQATAYYKEVLLAAKMRFPDTFEGLRRDASEQANIRLGVSASSSAEKYLKIDSTKWMKMESRHFLYLFKNKEVGKWLQSCCENHLRNIAGDLDFGVPEKKILVRVYANKAEYVEQGGTPGWSGGVCRYHKVGSTLEIEILTYQTSNGLRHGVIPHELTHGMIEANFFGRNSIPRWIHEGLAVGQEPEYRKRYLRKVLSKQVQGLGYIPISDLFEMNQYPKEPSAFYAQSMSMVEFIRSRHGKRSIEKLLRSLVKNDPQRAIRTSLGYSTLGAFESAWLKYAR